jgi:hypothetical protein
MEKNTEPQEIKDKKGVDPITLIIWGVLLILYGVYTTYNTLMADIQSNLLYIITPNLILTFFGVLVSFEGYKREKKGKNG